MSFSHAQLFIPSNHFEYKERNLKSDKSNRSKARKMIYTKLDPEFLIIILLENPFSSK